MSYPIKSCEIRDNDSMSYLFNPAHISPNELYDKYIPAGFKYFKIEGRTWGNKAVALAFADYLIKP